MAAQARGDPLKILHVITRCVRGGASGIVLSLARGLVARGHEVTVAAGPAEGPGGSFEAEFRACGAAWAPVPALVRDVRPLLDLRAAILIGRLIRSGRFDLVHTHTSKAGTLGRWSARWAGRPGIVHSPHGHVFSPGARIPGVSDRPFLRGLFFAVERLSAELGAYTVALTPAERDDLVRLRLVRPDRVRVIPNGIPEEWFHAPVIPAAEARSRAGLEASGPWIATIGRLAAEKGQEVVLAAFRAIAAERADVRLAVVGDGPERASLEMCVRECGLGARVRFLGAREDTMELYSAFDLVVQGSHYEAFGLVLLEAMARGCPVVATRVGGVAEVVEDGRTGLLVPPADACALGRAMRAALDDPQAARARADAARAHVAGRFSVHRMVDGYEEVYREAVVARGRPRGASSLIR